MGLFDNKNAIFGTALGASISFGQEWTIEDSIKLGMAISVLDAGKDDTWDD